MTVPFLFTGIVPTGQVGREGEDAVAPQERQRMTNAAKKSGQLYESIKSEK
jgi:hypothetical protein